MLSLLRLGFGFWIGTHDSSWVTIRALNPSEYALKGVNISGEVIIGSSSAQASVFMGRHLEVILKDGNNGSQLRSSVNSAIIHDYALHHGHSIPW